MDENLKKTYDLCGEEKGQEAMEHLFTHVHKLLVDRDYSACNDLLLRFDSGQVPNIVAIGLLRACFAANHNLPHWHVLLGEVRSKLGADHKLLRGL